MVVRVEYDRSNRVCIRSISNRPSRAVDQGGVQFFYRVPAACPRPPRRCGSWDRRYLKLNVIYGCMLFALSMLADT